jgi:hypothetical protein
MMRRIVTAGFLLVFFMSGISATTISLEQTGTGVVQKQIITEAKSYLGAPYRWGGTTAKGFDCSGLVFRVFSDILNRALPREVESLRKEGQRIEGNLLPADLVFFDTSGHGKATHVGIYIGNSRFIHAASAGRKQGIITSALSETYYKKRYLGARRLIETGFPMVKISFDNMKTPVQSGYQDILYPGIPLYFSLSGTSTATGFIEVTAYKNRKAVMEKRIRLAADGDPAVLWFIPDQGEWSVVVRNTDNKKIAQILFF